LDNTLNIGLLASGSGSNVEAILQSIKDKRLDANPCFVLSNNSAAPVKERAFKYAVPFYHISGRTHPEEDGVAFAIIDLIEKYQIDVLVLAGYMKMLPGEVIKHLGGKITNIHPSLLPKFGGAGMYGMRVHRAVIEAGETESGATVHAVTEEYDKGKILGRCRVDVDEDETEETLARKVLACEHKIYSIVLQKIASGEISW